MVDTLQKYLKYDSFSKKTIYSVPKSDLSDLDFSALPFDLSTDITKKLAINNGVGTIAITNNGTPFVFLGATISDVINAAKTQDIEIPNVPNNELIILLDDDGLHFKAILQNSTHHVIHDFYGINPLFLDLSDTASGYYLGWGVAFIISDYLPSSCKLVSKKNDTQIFAGIYDRPDSDKMPQTESLAIKYNGSYAVRFKVSDNEFYQIQEEILKIDNQCQNKELFYNLFPDEKQTENCLTSINKLVKAANIDTPYMSYFFDYQLQKAGSIIDLHFYHYKHKNELSSFKKLSDIIYHYRDFIYNTAIELAMLGGSFLAASLIFPGYAVATIISTAVTLGISSYVDFFPTLVEGEPFIDKNYQTLPCYIQNYSSQQYIPSKNPFETCVLEHGIQHPLSVDANGTLQRTIISYVWQEGSTLHTSTAEPQNNSFCIEHHVVKYHEEQPELIGDFHENTYSELAQLG